MGPFTRGSVTLLLGPSECHNKRQSLMLEHQLNTMDIVFTNRGKVTTSWIRKLEKANFAPCSLGDDYGKNRDRHRPRPSLRPSVYKSQVQHIVSLPMNQSQGKAVVPIWMILRTFCNLPPVSSTTYTRARPREMTRLDENS